MWHNVNVLSKDCLSGKVVPSLFSYANVSRLTTFMVIFQLLNKSTVKSANIWVIQPNIAEPATDSPGKQRKSYLQVDDHNGRFKTNHHKSPGMVP